MEQIKDLMKNIVSCVSAQATHMDQADTKEMSEAMDMIKDLAMAEYYCAVTKAMEDPENVYGEDWDENGPIKKGYSYSRIMMPRGYVSEQGNVHSPMYYTDDMMMSDMEYKPNMARGYSDNGMMRNNSRYESARRGYRSDKSSSSLNKIFDVIEEDMNELKPTMTPQDIQTAKQRLASLSSMI